MTSCFFHTASIVKAGFLDIQLPLTLQATGGILQVNPFPLVLAADAPHGLVEALDTHIRKHIPAPLPLDRQRCASDQAGSSERFGSRPTWVDDSRSHSLSRSRMCMPTDVSAPILGLGPRIWLMLGEQEHEGAAAATGEHQRRCCMEVVDHATCCVAQGWACGTAEQQPEQDRDVMSSLCHCALSPHLVPRPCTYPAGPVLFRSHVSTDSNTNTLS
ncbi:hypothetical protein DFH07DRAFT_949057 [Mycena maculata]|uniref:Uncharacterized protein n=1 Tax=Mycena maculata TaxID=230809 RepID=A0AAD7KBW3_9AGAR|nr:hypothetical protein DFH07DRAFT_949057 [Mycena maculata]